MFAVTGIPGHTACRPKHMVHTPASLTSHQLQTASWLGVELCQLPTHDNLSALLHTYMTLVGCALVFKGSQPYLNPCSTAGLRFHVPFQSLGMGCSNQGGAEWFTDSGFHHSRVVAESSA